MRRNPAVGWRPYPNGISPAARRPSGRDLGCRVALRKAAATHFRDRAARTATAEGTLHSGALAHDDAASEETQEAEKAAFSHTVIRWGSFGFGGGRMTKNLPVKGGIDGGPLRGGGPLWHTRDFFRHRRRSLCGKGLLRCHSASLGPRSGKSFLPELDPCSSN